MSNKPVGIDVSELKSISGTEDVVIAKKPNIFFIVDVGHPAKPLLDIPSSKAIK